MEKLDVGISGEVLNYTIVHGQIKIISLQIKTRSSWKQNSQATFLEDLYTFWQVLGMSTKLE